MEGHRVRRLGTPRRVEVEHGADGAPTAVGGRPVEQVLDEWRVEEGWWAGSPVSRTYFELVLEGGANAVVFRDRTGDWYRQRA